MPETAKKTNLTRAPRGTDALECGNTFDREADLLAAGLGNGLNDNQSTWLDVATLA